MDPNNSCGLYTSSIQKLKFEKKKHFPVLKHEKGKIIEYTWSSKDLFLRVMCKYCMLGTCTQLFMML